MVNMKNMLKLDYAENPELKSIFDGWEVGKSYTLEVTFQLNDKTDQGATATVEKVVDGSAGETSKAEDTEVEPDMTHPVMMVMSASSPPKSNAPEAAY